MTDAAPRLSVTFYGDDFTGSTAVMEVLSFAGVETMLFLEPPSLDVLARYPTLQAIGVAGVARSKDPVWMQDHLPHIFDALGRLNAPVTHYKTCSTFDSAPHVGSIGKATELGAKALGSDWVPLVVGAPEIGRYQVFGTLFADYDGQTYRLDRHPVMAHHPITPMGEADLTRHLSHQTDMKVGILDFGTLKSGQTDTAIARQRAQGAEIMAVDVLDGETLTEAGRLIWRNGAEHVFAVGSQGVEYALVAHWRTNGALCATHQPPRLRPVDQMFAVSGSCAPTTAAQIAYAETSGFRVIHFEAATAVDETELAHQINQVRAKALAALAQRQDVIVATARGPDDPALQRMSDAVQSSGTPAQVANERLGQALGELVRDIRLQTGLPRIVISGGDTSGHALSVLNVQSLTAVAPLAPGAPLCRLHTPLDPHSDGLEVALKGGQMGDKDFFVQAKGRDDT